MVSSLCYLFPEEITETNNANLYSVKRFVSKKIFSSLGCSSQTHDFQPSYLFPFKDAAISHQ